jgi:hypothetical protein
MSILNCDESQQACSNYIENLNGNSMTNFAFYSTYFTTCNKGYNYYDKSQFGNVTAQKGWIPFASAGPGYLSVDTSMGAKYSDYTFLLKSDGFNNFRRIDMTKNFRFHARVYYDYDDLPGIKVFTKQYSNKPVNQITATINLDNGLSQTAYGQVNLKSSNLFDSFRAILY